MDYKDTLFLPQTNFPMRGDLPKKEPEIFKIWFENNSFYEMMKISREDAKESFFIHDGPPYANGHIHIGHALNKILKDIIIKIHYFSGKKVRFVPGWDCHGLPIEQQVESDLKGKKEEISKIEFRELCRNHALKFVEIQKKEFENLGIVADWDNPYLTMKFSFEADIFKLLSEIAKKGLLIQRSKPVFWSWAAKSALAEAEVEYKDKEDYSLYVKFKLDIASCEKLGVSEAYAVIWTTTPWTLPANQAISLKPNEEYVLTKENLIFAKPLLKNLVEKGLSSGGILKEFSSNELENLFAINPLNDRKSRLILGDHVLMDGGTGLVHTAPGHGEDDYYVCLKYGIDVIMPVDESGLYDESIKNKKLFRDDKVDEFIGLHIFKANEKIIEILGNAVLDVSKFTHSYPHCWRTHKPVIYRATKQWFISMDEKVLNNKSLREVALDELEKVNFYPENAIKRLKTMIENRPDWCISRQRTWGVPIAFFINKKTKEPLIDEVIFKNVYDAFKSIGADAWLEVDTKDFFLKTPYNPDDYEKVEDILDVWFDSGSTWSSVLLSKNYDAGSYPSDMYLEGSDQHRGWFQSSLLLSCAINNKAPFKSILTHGFSVDKDGNKMSKSKGNVINPSDVASKYGVEILRLWVALSDYTSDLRISDDILKQISEQYRRIRNTIRFLLANISDLKEIDNSNFTQLDRWILNKATICFKEVKLNFDSYEFAKGFSLLLNFLIVELSGIYLDVCKDRLYCDSLNSSRRVSAQSVMAIILKSLLALLAPFLTYTIYEALSFAPKVIKSEIGDIFHLLYKPLEFNKEIDFTFALKAREKFLEIIDNLKKDKILKSTLELVLETSSKEILENKELVDLFLVSDIKELDENSKNLAEFEIDGEKFKITTSNEFKCPRCWRFKSKSEDELCTRCKEVINA